MLISKERLNYFCGITWFFLSLVVSITTDALTKHLSGQYSAAQIICLRYAFASLVLVAVIFRNKSIKLLTSKIPKLHFIRAILLLIAISLYCNALHELPIATVVSLNFMIPIFTLLFAYIFLKEKIRLGNIVATTVGFFGVCVIFEPSRMGFATFAAFLLLLSSALFAALDVINKKFLTSEGVFGMVFYTAVVTFMLSLPFAMSGWSPPSVKDICLFLLLGIGANLLLYCILKAFERVAVSSIASFRYLELVLACVVGLLFFGEIPSRATILGSLIIIPSTLYIAFNESNGQKIKAKIS